MKRLLTLVAFFATIQASAQQVNPVPDYVFANRMSAGRNTVTDTAAYFSIGPRYGATRGMMPPMVVDTASFSANKRNGLLIFSVQKNKFLYWDSVGAKWAEMAGTAGNALTSADTTALLSTRAWRQKGIDSLAAIRIAGAISSGYIPKGSASNTIANSILYTNDTSVSIGIGTNRSIWSGITALELGHKGNAIAGINNDPAIYITSNAYYDGTWRYANSSKQVSFYAGEPARHRWLVAGIGAAGDAITFGNGMTLTANSRLLVNTSTESTYQIDVAGNIRSTTGARFATSSGAVGIGTTNADAELHVEISNSTAYNSSDILAVDPILYLINNNTGNDVAATIRLDPGTQSGNSVATISGIRTGAASAAITFGTRNSGGNIAERARIKSDGEFLLGYTADQGTYVLQANGNALITGNIRTAAPAGGTANDWRLGTVATVSPTSPNRTIEVSIGGTIYYIAAKTTND